MSVRIFDEKRSEKIIEIIYKLINIRTYKKSTQRFCTYETVFYFIEYLFYELNRSSAITLGMSFPASGRVDIGVGRPRAISWS